MGGQFPSPSGTPPPRQAGDIVTPGSRLGFHSCPQAVVTPTGNGFEQRAQKEDQTWGWGSPFLPGGPQSHPRAWQGQRPRIKGGRTVV